MICDTAWYVIFYRYLLYFWVRTIFVVARGRILNSPNDNQYIADNRDEHEKLQPTATTSVVETACGYGDGGQQKHETANTASQRGNDVGEKLEPPKFRAASTAFKVGKLIEAHFDCFAEVHRL